MAVLQTPQQAASWLREHVGGALRIDSRAVQSGDGFIAWPGAATDGRSYVPSAMAQGAAACLVEDDGAAAFGFNDSRIAPYAGLKAAAGPIAAAYYDDPTRELDVLAVTGTNGKTSTAWWLAQALSNAEPPHKIRCGLVGTLGIGSPPDVEFNGLTTPDPVRLQEWFRRFVDRGFTACAIEASSVGIAERRLDGTQIRVAIFTNFTQDHLDYHGSMEAYWQAKAELFRWPHLRAAVINVDDAAGMGLAASLRDTALDLWTVSCVGPARLQARHIAYGAHGIDFDVVEDGETTTLRTALIGQYNVANLLGVIAAMRAMGVPLHAAVQACAGLLPVPGRMECIALDECPLVAVDYAHTPDALDKALDALRPLAMQRGGALWCVFGCGGDRDATKRPLMAAVAEKNADHVVVTSDNPRTERPEHIISQILLGLSRRDAVQVEADRAQAIEQAVARAGQRDVVLVAGKGHEDYQEIGGAKLPFSDRAQAQAALARRAATGATGRANA